MIKDSVGLYVSKRPTAKTKNSALKHMWKQCKFLWVYPSNNLERCPVCIID